MHRDSPRALQAPSTTLTFAIAGCSEHSGRYVAQNIMLDSPTDQSSRWSGANPVPNVNQWILLRLETLSVLKSITFGKFHKPHPCNMKEFKIYAGMNEDHMTEVLHSGLKNDSIPETFSVKQINSAGVCFPTRYIKIVPLSAHGQSFHTSIWYVSLSGITDQVFLEQVRTQHEEYRETAVLRQILKHLRQRRLLTPYQTILSRSRLQVEDHLVTDLHQQLVLKGDWQRVEQLLHEISDAGLFDAYLHSCQPHTIWKRLLGVDPDGDVPTKRGGHAMCIDPESGTIYLFGGWDGQKCLDDFWAYSTKEDKWKVLSHKTSGEKNGPGARSCHKMVYDLKTGCIYVLGRLSNWDAMKPRADIPPSATLNVASTDQPPASAPPRQPTTESSTERPSVAFCSEFYRYHTRGLDAGKWDLLSFDTAAGGGPPLVFDHQMVMDCEAQILYVFGGRVVDGDWESAKYSGLYSYNVRLSKWRMLQPSDPSNSSQTAIPSRFGHSMVLEPSSRTLYIFAGQRDEKYLSDMYAYDINTNTVTELFSNFSASGGPDACFTQRAVIDTNLREIYVFCGLTRSAQVGSITVLQSEAPNWMYRYDSRPGKWTQILAENDDESQPESEPRVFEEPLPRYAHQVVYDSSTKTVFMHGGNAGLSGAIEPPAGTAGRGEDNDEAVDETEGGKGRRLDDFWKMTLKRPAREEVIRRATYQIRQQQFREMCEEFPPVKALNFLQQEVSSVVDHNNPEETEVFRSLLSHLLAPPVASATSMGKKPLKEDSIPTKRSSPAAWTNKIDEDEVMGDMTGPAIPSSSENKVPSQHVSSQILVATEDEAEQMVRGDAAVPLSGLRFEQRTSVFERLLEYVEDAAKQPSGSLLDMVDEDRCSR